MNSSNFVNVKW